MLEVILICIAVCADAFTAAYAYGLKGYKLGPLPAVIIGFTGAAFLGTSLTASYAVSSILPGGLCKTLSASLLILIAMNSLAGALRQESSDAPESMTVKGSLILAAALSVDSLGVGFGAGVTMTGLHKLYAALLCFVLGVLSVFLGQLSGRLLSKKASRYRTTLISSTILFIIAVMKLV